MSLNVKKLTPLARVPVETTDGSYEFFAANNYIVMAGTSLIISTGLAISIPTGYNARVYSTSAAESSDIEVSNFCSINHHSYKCTTNQSVQELKIILRNFSTTDYHVKTGDIIAKMIVHQIKRLPVYEVEKLDDITQDFSVQMKLRNVKSFPGRVRTWFILEYKNSPDKFREKYTNQEIIAEFETFKETQDYIRSRTKIELEAKFIFNKIEKCEDKIDDPPITFLEKIKIDHGIAKTKATAMQ